MFLIFLVLTLIPSLLFCYRDTHIQCSQNFESVSLLTEKTWTDWNLTDVTKTFQGAVTDKRFSDFPPEENKSKILSLHSSLSFSVLQPNKVKIFSFPEQYLIHKYSDRTNKSWIHYTLLQNNDKLCLLENDVFITTNRPLSRIKITTDETTKLKIHNYQLRTADHISEKPTTIQIPPRVSFLTLYVYLCAHCSLEVHLPIGGKKELYKDITALTDLWKPDILVVENEPNITFVRTTTNGRYDGYWSLDLRPHCKDVETQEKSADASRDEKQGSILCSCGFTENSKILCQESCNMIPQVEFTHTEFTKTTLTYFWKVSTSCTVQDFVIYFQNRKYYTTNYSYSFKNLNACEKYTISVAARVGTKTGENSSKTVEIEMKANLTLSQTANNSVVLTWTVPKNLVTCVSHYRVSWNDKSQVIASSTSFLELPLRDCIKNINFTATLQSGKNYTRLILNTMQSTPMKPPQLVAVTLGEKSVDLTLGLDRNCGPTNLNILCGTNFKSLNFTDYSTTRNFSVEITSNFSCSSSIQNSPRVKFLEFKSENGTHNFSFPLPSQSDFSTISVKTDPLKITHEFFSSTSFIHFNVCYGAKNCLQTKLNSTELSVLSHLVTINVETASFVSPNISFYVDSIEESMEKSIEGVTESKLMFITYGSLVCLLITLTILLFKIWQYLKIKRKNLTWNNQADSNLLLSEVEMSTSIEIGEFDQLLSSEFLERIQEQFKCFGVDQNQPLTVAVQPSNINKNRKRDNYFPYDSNRVILRNSPGLGKGNYINASFIDGYDRPDAYIAAQGPKLCTIKNFWRLVWQEDVRTIIMASNSFENKERMCAEYWPSQENGIYECGKMIVKLINQSFYDCYVFRKLEVSYQGYRKMIIQLQVRWASHSDGYYPNNLLPIIKYLRQKHALLVPTLVHSGLGVGRTGTIILCDLALEMLKDKEKADFFSLTQTLRKQRLFMVKDLEHYALAHFTVKEYLMQLQNPVKFFNKDSIKDQLERLETLCLHDAILQKLASKDRKQERYLNITSVCRYGGMSKFLVTPEPTVQEFAAFWTMVAQESIEYIVFLNKSVHLGNDSINGSKEVIQLNQLTETKVSFCTVKKCSLLIYDATSKQIIHDKSIQLFEFNNWKEKKQLPNSLENFIKMVDGVNKVPQKPTLIVCGDGFTASGLFVVLSFVIDQYKSEFDIDVCPAVRIARRGGKKFVESEKQLKFIYSCISEFSKNYESYQTVDFV